MCRCSRAGLAARDVGSSSRSSSCSKSASLKSPSSGALCAVSCTVPAAPSLCAVWATSPRGRRATFWRRKQPPPPTVKRSSPAGGFTHSHAWQRTLVVVSRRRHPSPQSASEIAGAGERADLGGLRARRCQRLRLPFELGAGEHRAGLTLSRGGSHGLQLPRFLSSWR